MLTSWPEQGSASEKLYFTVNTEGKGAKAIWEGKAKKKKKKKARKKKFKRFLKMTSETRSKALRGRFDESDSWIWEPWDEMRNMECLDFCYIGSCS